MSRNPIVLHSTLAPDAVADALTRSIDLEGVPQYMVPWFIRLLRKGVSRSVCGVVERNTFRLRSRDGGQCAHTFYAKWEPEHSGTRIVKRGEKGIFILAPMIGELSEEEATAAADKKCNGEARLHGFRAAYVFDRLSS